MRIEQKPIEFLPYLKSVVWGGDKICAYKGMEQMEPNIGESWEISAVPGHESVVKGGSYDGRNLTDLVKEFGASLLGTEVMKRYDGNFPLLIKIIDAAQNLSVQVHPDDALAMKRHDSLGKTEMWYIIQSDKGAKIYAGLNVSMTPDEYVERVAAKTFAETLASYDSSPGDVFFLPAGRVHAIGAGNLLAEIQESSDVTYRIYDYDRLGADGKPRELHTELAKDAIDFTVHDTYRSPRPDPSVSDCEIVRCDHFITDRIQLDGEMEIAMSQTSFKVLMCLAGYTTIRYPDGSMELRAGHTVLIPADMPDFTISGSGILLTTHS